MDLITVITIFGLVSLTKPQCFNDFEFAIRCSTVYSGIKSGARCFYTYDAWGTWDNAWTFCAQTGGVLAHVHSSQEHQSIMDWLNKKYTNTAWNAVWIALKRVHSSLNQTCAYDFENLYWYDNATVFNPKLKGGNTWSRKHAGDDCVAGRGDCMYLAEGVGKFVDGACTSGMVTLCMVQNPAQTYSAFPTCLTEEPTRSYTTSGLYDCAKNCDYATWCRSLNYRNSTGACDLFSWSARDNPNMEVLHGCVNYSYDP